jgi:hypothetical protein
VRVGSSTGQVAGGQSVVVNGFTVETRNVTLRDYTILIVFRVRNRNPDLNAVCNIAVYADTNVGSNGSHHVGPIPNGEGVYWSGISNQMFYVMNVFGSGYPLTTTFSSFWFGYWNDMDDNYWNSTSRGDIVG